MTESASGVLELHLAPLGASWAPFWASWAPKLAPSSVQEGSRTVIFSKNVIVKKHHKTSWFLKVFAPQDGTKNGPRSAQDAPKTILKRHFFMLDFVFDFGAFWGPILAPFWGPKLAILGVLFRSFFGRRPKGAPRAPQEAPRGPKGRPKRPQKAPREAPRAPQEAPRAPKKVPKRPQEASRGPKRSQKARGREKRAVQNSSRNTIFSNM